MKFIPMGSMQVPAIGLGTYKLTGLAAIDTFLEAFRIGYRLVDTAQLYMNEDEVGKALALSGLDRKEFIVVTKVWPTNFTSDRFIPSVKESLKKLRTDYVDLLLIHWPHPQFKVSQYIQFLAQAKEEGFAKEIGVSNYNIEQINTAINAGIPILTNEIEFHPWINQRSIREHMQQHNMPIIAYTPLGRGMMVKDKIVADIAKEHQRMPAQIVLRWMMQQEDIIAIPKATSTKHLLENLNVFDFTLSTAGMSKIDSLANDNLRVVPAQPGAKWD